VLGVFFVFSINCGIKAEREAYRIRITSCAEIASSAPAIRLERRDETSSRQARRRHRDGSQNRGVATMTRDIKKRKKGKRNARRENHEGRDSGGTIYVH